MRPARSNKIAPATGPDSLRLQIKEITGTEVREATAKLEMAIGGTVQVSRPGTMVQVFRLARSVPADAWSGNGSDVRS